MTAFVIGNGLSRKGIDLTKLKGTTYGCNWLYTEFTPDILVAVDRPISDHIQNTFYPTTNKFYTRKVYAETGALPLCYRFKNWSSGSNAIQLAVFNNHDSIVLLGFDFGKKSEKSNNIYTGTKFYNDIDSVSTYSWLNEISTILRMNKRIKFTIVQGEHTTTHINNFKSFTNVKIICTADFIKEYIDVM